MTQRASDIAAWMRQRAAMAERGLGTFTMLKEIEWSIATGREFYYQGYVYEGESFYDYKKRFRGTEAFDWGSDWYELKG